MKWVHKLLPVLVLPALAVGAAQARTVNLGDLSGDNTLTLEHHSAGSTFTDTFLFLLSEPTRLFWSLTDIRVPGIGRSGPLLDGSYNYSLYDGSDLVSSGHFNNRVQRHADFDPGNFRLVVSGTALGSRGATYALSATGSLLGSPTPVPEPETWAAMLGGLGLAGVLIARRKKTSGEIRGTTYAAAQFA